MILFEKYDNDTLELLKITKAICKYLAGASKKTKTGQNPIDLAQQVIPTYSSTRSLVHFLKRFGFILKQPSSNQREPSHTHTYIYIYQRAN